MTPPNYFRWIKTESAVQEYDGYTLNLTNDFDGQSAWDIYTTAPAYSDLQHTEDFDGSTAWGIYSTAASYSDLEHDENFDASGSDWPSYTP